MQCIRANNPTLSIKDTYVKTYVKLGFIVHNETLIFLKQRFVKIS